jgi:hypothetical protein
MEFVIKNKGEKVIIKEDSRHEEKPESEDIFNDITRD